MISIPLTPGRVRELTKSFHQSPARKPRKRVMAKLTPDKIAVAERMVYVDGKTFREAAQFAGCSLSRIYRVLSLRRAAKREGGAA